MLRPRSNWTVIWVEPSDDDELIVEMPAMVESCRSIGEATDVHVLTGHGVDPNSSPQGGGHAQASPHAHIVVVDPSIVLTLSSWPSAFQYRYWSFPPSSCRRFTFPAASYV